MSPEKSDAGQEAANLHDTDGVTKSDSNGEDRGSHPISTTTGQTTCSVCQSTFRRPEHLKRHFRSHTKEKPFECTQCGRHFSRTDTLHRHELSHHTLASDGGKDRTHRITVKTFRACFKCAVARVRCSGGTPCTRCDARSLECQYPTERRSKAKGRKDTPHSSSLAKDGVSHKKVSGHDQSSDTGDSLTQLGEQLSMQAPGYQIGQFQVQLPGLRPSNPSSNISSDHDSHQKSSIPPIGPSTTQHNPESHRTSETVPFQIYDEIEPQQSYPRIPTSDVRGTYSATTPGPGMNDHMRRSYPELANRNMNAQMTQEDNQQAQLIFDQPFIDQSGLSKINWIPNDLLLDTTKDSPVILGLQSQDFQTGTPVNALGPNIVPPHVISRTFPETISQTPPANTSLATDIDNPNFSVGNTAPSLKSQPGASSAPKRSGDFVNQFDVQSSKYPRTQDLGRKSSADFVDALLQMHKEDTDPHFSFLIHGETTENLAPENKTTPEFQIDNTTYDNIYQAFHRLCCTNNSFYQKFDSTNFPTAKHLSSFISLYFDCFQAGYPILHRPTFDPNRCHWLLVLAVSAIGCQYATKDYGHFVQAFHEFARRSISVELEKYRLDRVPLWLVQAFTLNCIGLLHGGSERGGIAALNNFDDGQASLPSHEDLWQANSAADWRELFDKSPEKENPSLYDAVLTMYIEKSLIPGVGEFSQTLLIHALYHRMWEVGDYFRRPLSFWNPTAKKQARNSAIPSGSVWLPGIPSYSKWRNSACDCLDILHWTANCVISRTGGLGHPTVLHLHEARIILLTPYREIRTLATLLATKQAHWTERQQTMEWHYILRWIKHDQYKARLAVVHSGTTLWHVRRYAANTFHETVAVFLATLTLWAYGLCHGQVFQDIEPEHHRSIERRSIHLDGPFNDELYQTFVREGEVMRAVVTDVGDICGPHGPEEVLQFGCAILHKLSSWGISKRLIAVLTQLYEVSSRH
ncbi:hypothetical protein FE257_006488 [Aspergillus nanangensis]|uniref:C2H2 type zinc finger domain protein n=1 Tax=Aspergillus nanangensis TaxID=2582783 RepID=A0AAD4CXL6_ASPNN|nr:hypothetical protein FE257_006488 [Aspergillus nanangensis]